MGSLWVLDGVGKGGGDCTFDGGNKVFSTQALVEEGRAEKNGIGP